jgi:hypothetical protein
MSKNELRIDHPVKLISPEANEYLKNKANELVQLLGYDPKSSKLEVVNIQEAYCFGYFQADRDNKKGGFFDLKTIQESCAHVNHEPPVHIYIPENKYYKHICPGCGKTVNMIKSGIII